MIILRSASWLLLLSVSATDCAKRDQRMPSDQDQPQHFPAPDEAVQKAKQDFAAVLSSNKQLDLGVDSATLARSQPGKPVKRVELDFEKLLAADTSAGFDALVKSERNTVVPLVADDRVVTIVEVNRDEQGWKVIGLAGKDIADDLTTVRTAFPDAVQSDITLYEVPNLQARVYGVKRNGTETLFTSYGNRFSLRKGVSPAMLTAVLKSDAIAFQQKYGEALKKQRLVR
jgi:hypothetical protein